jgi:Mg2+ and Co2+ transporter CorA
MAAKDARTNLSLAETSTIIAEASKEDSAVMRTIALDTQRDSSAMKTISILGMVFLPGTFIAVSLPNISVNKSQLI